MGRKGNWFSSVKKALSPESKKNKGQKSNKSELKWSGKEKSAVPESSPSGTVTVSRPLPLPEEVKLTGVEDEQTKHAYSVAVATAVAAEAAVAAAQAAAEVVRLTAVTRFTGKSKEEVAAIKIQTAFRGYLVLCRFDENALISRSDLSTRISVNARRALRALRGLVRLKSLVQWPTVKRQTINALRSMQTAARVQSQIQSRRIRMSDENQALQRQLLQKRAKELVNLRIGEEWDDSLQSKEQIEASLLSKYEAAIRRERALAYSFSHQKTCKKSTGSATLMFMDLNNPYWSWSWLERFIGARQLDTQGTTEKELNNDQSSVKSASLSTVNGGGEITKAYFRHQLNSDKPSPRSTRKPVLRPSTQRSPSTPPSQAASFSTVARKSKAASPSGGSLFSPDDDMRSIFSVQSGMNRRHSIAGSSVRDNESLASSPAVPSYMAPTQSAKAKSRMQSASLSSENGTPPEKEPAASAKKRLSYPASPARLRRHSGPPKVDLSSAA